MAKTLRTRKRRCVEEGRSDIGRLQEESHTEESSDGIEIACSESPRLTVVAPQSRPTELELLLEGTFRLVEMVEDAINQSWAVPGDDFPFSRIRLCPYGSTLLGLDTVGSDIDAIVCIAGRSHITKKLSFYMECLKNALSTSLQVPVWRIRSRRHPLVRFKLKNKEFDLQIAYFPTLTEVTFSSHVYVPWSTNLDHLNLSTLSKKAVDGARIWKEFRLLRDVLVRDGKISESGFVDFNTQVISFAREFDFVSKAGQVGIPSVGWRILVFWYLFHVDYVDAATRVDLFFEVFSKWNWENEAVPLPCSNFEFARTMETREEGIVEILVPTPEPFNVCRGLVTVEWMTQVSEKMRMGIKNRQPEIVSSLRRRKGH